MEVELIKALPGGGSLVICVALVILFLRHIKEMSDKTEKAMTAMSEKFNEEHIATRTAFQEQIGSITGKVIDIAEKTASAVKGLEAAVRELQNKIHGD